MNQKVYIFLFNGFADWEIGFLTPEIYKSEKNDLIYFSKDGRSVSSMGGLQVNPTISLKEVKTSEVDMLILPGGTAWEKDENKGIEGLVKTLFESGKDIAAICAATTYLGKLGILDDLHHTSNDLNYLKQMVPQYLGEEKYVHELAVSDKNITTANGIAPIEFAKEIFTQLKLYEIDYIEKWFQLFKNGIWSE